LIYTLNEEVNLPFCLDSLKWCDDIVVIDSFSTDRTEALAQSAGARFVQHEFTGFGDQRMWSLEHVPLKHRWALILDADERVPPELAAEFSARLPTVAEDVGAFRLRRRYHLWGRWLRHSSLYPVWVVRLIRVGRIRYINRGHAETQVVDGRTESLVADLIDENHKGLEDWFWRQNQYTTKEARYELNQPPLQWSKLFTRDPLQRRAALRNLFSWLPGRPLWFFLYAYVVRLGFLDGMDGLRYCLMNTIREAMVGLKKHELRRRRRPSGSAAPDSERVPIERKELASSATNGALPQGFARE
jgi:glycosyltransferase involved in cell wall biosynthesis